MTRFRCACRATGAPSARRRSVTGAFRRNQPHDTVNFDSRVDFRSRPASNFQEEAGSVRPITADRSSVTRKKRPAFAPEGGTGRSIGRRPPRDNHARAASVEPTVWAKGRSRADRSPAAIRRKICPIWAASRLPVAGRRCASAPGKLDGRLVADGQARLGPVLLAAAIDARHQRAGLHFAEAVTIGLFFIADLGVTELAFGLGETGAAATAMAVAAAMMAMVFMSKFLP